MDSATFKLIVLESIEGMAAPDESRFALMEVKSAHCAYFSIMIVTYL